MSDHEPPHRVQRYPLPESMPVIAAARERRLAWVDAMCKVSQSSIDETERSCRDDDLPIDNAELQEYDGASNE